MAWINYSPMLVSRAIVDIIEANATRDGEDGFDLES